jgi:hypothetical protein
MEARDGQQCTETILRTDATVAHAFYDQETHSARESNKERQMKNDLHAFDTKRAILRLPLVPAGHHRVSVALYKIRGSLPRAL